MTLATIVYLIYTLSNIKMFLVSVAAISGFTLAVTSILRIGRQDYSWNYKDRDQTILKDDVTSFRKLVDKSWKYAAIALVSTETLNIVIPSEKTAWLMVGAYAGQKVAENENVQRLSGKVLTVIEQNVDKYTQENIDNQTKSNNK